MIELKEGDVIYLRSGGPAMTIIGVNENQSYTCIWFDRHHTLQTRSFTNTVVVKENPAPRSKSVSG